MLDEVVVMVLLSRNVQVLTYVFESPVVTVLENTAMNVVLAFAAFSMCLPRTLQVRDSPPQVRSGLAKFYKEHPQNQVHSS